MTTISNASISAATTNSTSSGPTHVMSQAPNPPPPSKTYSINNANRELVTDKANVIASLNNINNNTSHFYQNIQPLKQTQNQTNGAANQSQTTPHHHHQQQINISSSIANNPQPALSGAKNLPSNLSKQRTLDGYVGFANLPNQVYRKSVKKGFEFNLMVIGESGLGKSTFINSLFLTELYNENDFPGTFERRNKKTTFVDATTVLLTEKGVNLRLTVVDTPGFGDSIDNTNCWTPIIDYIDSKYEDYLSAESKVNRKLPISDQRIHCCLFFISAGHSLKQLDIEVMKKLHDRVNLIPVIAKADTMTADEMKQFKLVVLNAIAEQKLQIYEFPDIDDDDIENNRTNSILKVIIVNPIEVMGFFNLIFSKTLVQTAIRYCGKQHDH